VIAFGGATTGASALTLSGTTTRSNALAPQLAVHTKGDITSWASQNYTGSVVGPNRTDAVEVLANPNPSTAANPDGCTLQGAGAGKYHIYRIHPGVYYGGISIMSRARVYMAPGTYWLAGGGLTINGANAQLISVDGPSSTTPTTAASDGVFIYDTEDDLYHDQCVAGTAPAGACIGAISVNGTSSNNCPASPEPSLANPYIPNPPSTPCQWVHLNPANSPVNNLLVFVDRNLTANIRFNGDAGKLELNGTIYNPKGDVQINGGADDTVSAQIISYTFHITGNGGFTVTYNADEIVQLSGVGLVH
jgi:hypothetical protein